MKKLLVFIAVLAAVVLGGVFGFSLSPHFFGNIVWPPAGVAITGLLVLTFTLLAFRAIRSERLRAEDALRQSKHQLRFVWENSVDGMRLINGDGLILAVNKSYCELMQRPREKLENKSIATLYPPGKGEEVLKLHREDFLNRNFPSHVEKEMVLPDGRNVHLELSNSFLDLAGHPPLLLSVFRNIDQRKRIEQRNTAFSKLGERLNATHTPLEAARAIAALTVELFDWDAFTLNLYSYENGHPVIHPVLNADTINGVRRELTKLEVMRAYTPRELRILQNGAELMLKQEPLTMTPDLMAFGDTTRPSASLMFAPIRNQNQTLAVLSVHSYKVNAYDREDLRVLQMLADFCGSSLDRIRAETAMREFPAQILQAQESERKRVAQELHDSVNQILFATKFRLDSAEEAGFPTEHAATENFTKAREMLNKAMQEVGRISRNLRPSELDDLGLAPAVRSLCHEFQHRTGINVELELPENNSLPPGIELTLYRIIQEALNNVEKHSEASQMKLSLAQQPLWTVLRIRDNGVGLQTAAPRRSSGMGLVGMQERAAFAGGSVEITSNPDSGTVIEVKLPAETGQIQTA